MEKTIEKVKIVTKTDVQGTLANLRIGVPTSIRNAQIKACSVRSGVKKLALKGYEFDISERGRVDDIIVTRIK